MTLLKSLLVFLLIFYAGFAGLLYFMQRGMMYFPDRNRTPPSAVGLPAEEVKLKTADGETVLAWHVPPRGEKPVVLYFHGNGGALALRAERFRGLIEDGTGLLALSYRGYGGSTGWPSETGLIEDARAAYDFAVARYPVERLVVWGESLGTGVAVALAAEKPVGRMVLEAPFTSAAEIASAVYPFIPIRLLMKDQFRSDERIAQIKAPILVLHGTNDAVIPIAYGERLYALIKGEKRFARLDGAPHEGLDAYGALKHAREFIGAN